MATKTKTVTGERTVARQQTANVGASVAQRRLSDGSHVYDVQIWEANNPDFKVEVNAISEKAAYAFRTQFNDMIRTLTVNA